MENNNKMAAVSCGHIGSGSGAVLGGFRSGSFFVHHRKTSIAQFFLDFFQMI